MRNVVSDRSSFLVGLLVVAGPSCQDGSPNPRGMGAEPGRETAAVAASTSSTAVRPSIKPTVVAVSHPAASSPPVAAACPPEMQLVVDTCVDRYEAHLVQLLPDGRAILHPAELRPASGQHYAARSAPAVKPQAYVNRREAADACQNAGKRLCTLREWYRACTGTQGTAYPYGPSFVAGRCNTGKPHLLGRLFGSDPRAWKYEEHFNSPTLNREPGFLAPAGFYADCRSDAGTFDMVGNLHEWVSDRVDYELTDKIPLRDDIRAKIGSNYGKAIFMGGFYSTSGEHGQGCRFLTPGHGWKYHDYSTGFRCCRDR